MAESMTFNSLITDVENYLERTDTNLINSIPRFVMYAENRIAAELKIQGFQTPISGTFQVGMSTLPKPAFWRDTISFNLTDLNGNRVEILPRSYEYCRNVYTNPTTQAQPRFYADYDPNNFLISPTPDQAYNFELLYHARLQPLDVSHQTNWMTITVPQLLFYATMIEAQIFLKNTDMMNFWQSNYDRTMAALNKESQDHKIDRTIING
jgi:hypothetical protein